MPPAVSSTSGDSWLNCDRRAAIRSPGKGRGVSLCTPVGVHDEALHARAKQVIEGVGDERFVGDRDERLGPLLGERFQARAEPGTEDECGLQSGAPCSRRKVRISQQSQFFSSSLSALPKRILRLPAPISMP